VHVPADAVLRVARCVEGGDGDVLAEREGAVVRRGAGYVRAVCAAEDGEGVGFEDLGVAARVVPVVVRVEDLCEGEGFGR
jgi:hypothetical protein